MDDNHLIEQIILKLKDASSRDDRYPIFQEYHGLIKGGLSLEAGLRAINAATEFPPSTNVTDNPAASLIGYLADSRFPRDHGKAAIPAILELYPALPDKARHYAIWLLMNIPERDGALAVMDLVRRYLTEGGIPEHAFNTGYLHPLHADVYFPELLDYAHLSASSYGFQIWHICLNYCNARLLRPEQIISRGGVVGAEYADLKAKLLPAQQEDWRTNYQYLADRETGGLMLDLMRFLPSVEIKRKLSSAVTDYRDPVLLLWAAVSLLWLDLPVPAAIIETVAASDEARKLFYEKLKDHNRVSIFPEKFKTKAALAQSDLVQWLTYPTELGHVPEAIELTHIIVEKTSDSEDEWFLFRFRDPEMDSAEWLAGWSGPFPTESPPGETLTPGNTFSHFDRWDSKSPEDLIGLTDESDPPPKLKVIPQLT